jgi:hypothetical protein
LKREQYQDSEIDEDVQPPVTEDPVEPNTTSEEFSSEEPNSEEFIKAYLTGVNRGYPESDEVVTSTPDSTEKLNMFGPLYNYEALWSAHEYSPESQEYHVKTGFVPMDYDDDVEPENMEQQRINNPNLFNWQSAESSPNQYDEFSSTEKVPEFNSRNIYDPVFGNGVVTEKMPKPNEMTLNINANPDAKSKSPVYILFGKNVYVNTIDPQQQNEPNGEEITEKCNFPNFHIIVLQDPVFYPINGWHIASVALEDRHLTSTIERFSIEYKRPDLYDEPLQLSVDEKGHIKGAGFGDEVSCRFLEEMKRRRNLNILKLQVKSGQTYYVGIRGMCRDGTKFQVKHEWVY